jgi:hypothetical protein
MTTICVIVRSYANNAPAFWTGNGWSSEYADARLITVIGARRIVARKGERGIPVVGDIAIVVDYGLATERKERP